MPLSSESPSTTHDKTRCRTYRFRLHPTYKQTQALCSQLKYQRELYNAALEERIGKWKWNHLSVSFFDQCKTLTGLEEFRPEVLSSGVILCRGTLRRLDLAFAAFYRRVSASESPGFPRFKSARNFSSLQWEDNSGWKVRYSTNRLYLLGIGEVKANYHRVIQGEPKAITVKREGTKWWLSVRCTNVPAKPLVSTGREAGIDLGVANIVTTSDGELILGEQHGSRAKDKLAKAQQRLSRQRHGSKRRADQAAHVAALYRKVNRQRMNSHHQLSRKLINTYDLMVLEDLSIKSMVKRPDPLPDPDQPGKFLSNGATAKARITTSIYDAGWGTLVSLLLYKAESAGREVVLVDPRYTSQTCHECGYIAASNRVTQAVFKCQVCGHKDHADINAAKNILRAGRAPRALARTGRN